MTQPIFPDVRCLCGTEFTIDVSTDPPLFFAGHGHCAQCPDCGRDLAESAVSEEVEHWLRERPAGHPERRPVGVGSTILVTDPYAGEICGQRATVFSMEFTAFHEGRGAGVCAVEVVTTLPDGRHRLARLRVGEFWTLTAPTGDDYIAPPPGAACMCCLCGSEFQPHTAADEVVEVDHFCDACNEVMRSERGRP